MKLLRAVFQNFRLLRDLELSFSTDPKRKLTVIRAANESGKTTVLTGLQWALYGDNALPGKGESYRLHPIDWDATKTKRVPITVTVDFEVTSQRKAKTGGFKETRRNYRIVRSVFEEIEGKTWRKGQSRVKLFELTDRGAEPIENPEALVADELPIELREVFFTDGDRALSFIEADVALSTKRDRVQSAIRALLGLQVVEDSVRHVKKTASEINKEAKKLGGDSDLPDVAARLETIDSEASEIEKQLKDATEQFANFDQQVVDTDHKIAAALQKGDREKLRKDLAGAKQEIVRLDDRIEAATKEHSALFRSEGLARDLLAPVLKTAFQQLDDLRDKGKIPNTTIPILEDRLNSEVCICGESLALSNEDGRRRRAHIEHVIESSRKADEIQGIVTDLYFGSKSLLPGPSTTSWLDAYRKVLENRDSLDELRDAAGRKLKSLELLLDGLPNTDIQSLREARRHFLTQRDRFLQKQTQLTGNLDHLQRERKTLVDQRDSLLREQKKGSRIIAELQVTQDIVRILEGAYERLTNEELRKVSDGMNNIFLEMIGADPEQGAIIKAAKISDEFDILVYGPDDRMLNPDRDLNGASRRALTLAFILALTKVSEVVAPNVIDTPLGMMSGYVKRSVLKKAIAESAQLVLFLTPDEIQGCEEILDHAAGVVFTLTNPAHYPTMLQNDPKVKELKVLRCECNHRRTCALCERKADLEVLAVEPAA